MPLINEVKGKGFSVGIYMGAAGYFYLPNELMENLPPFFDPTSCRETFHSKFRGYEASYKLRNKDYNWYAYGILSQEQAYGNLSTVSLFVDKVEDRLNLSQRTIFYPTENKLLAAIYPSRFWLDDEVRHTFFSCVLRAALNNASVKDFEKTLSGYKYLNPDLVKHFLDGNTKYTGNYYSGIYQTFKNKYQKELETLLIRG